MFSNELEKLLIEHLADLDEGVRRLEMLQSNVAEAIDQGVADWTSQTAWVKGEGTWKDAWDASVGPPHWLDADGKWLAWFELSFGAGDDGSWSDEKDFFWLTRLCREGRGHMGFRFVQREFGRTQWKRSLQKNRDRFVHTRFVLDDEPSLFLPIKVDKHSLAEAAEEGDFSKALAPITEALDHIREVLPLFEQTLKELRELPAS